MAEPAHKAITEQSPKSEHGGGFPPFQTETFASQLVWLVIAFVLLYALMVKLALPRVTSIIESRQKRIDDDIAEAGSLKRQSDEAVAAYEKALADAHARALVIVNETRERQQAAADATRKQLEDQLNAKLADAENSIAATKQTAMANVRSIAEDTARAIIERLSGAVPNDKAVVDAVANALKR